MPQGDAGRIREHATRLVEQARREGKEHITIRAGNVHDALDLRQAHANVGQALEGATFHRQAGVELVGYRGVKSRRGANSEFVFSIQPVREQASDWRRQVSELPTGRTQASDWRKRVLELPIGEFQGLVGEYLKAKGYSDAEVRMVIRMMGQE